MLCSRCSEPFGPVVAIDIDGTLGDYHSHFLQFASSWTGFVPPADIVYSGREKFSTWVCEVYGIDITTFRMIKLAYRQGGMKRTMPAYRNAADLTVGLIDAGAEVWLTTTRPHDRYDRIDPDTKEWIRRHGIAFHGLLFGEYKMEELAARIDPERVVAVLDDLPIVLVSAEEQGWRTLLRRTYYNAGADWRGPEVPTLAAALGTMSEWIREWGWKHA